MNTSEFELKFATRASGEFSDALGNLGLEFIDLRSATSEQRRQTSEFLALAQCKVNAVFDAFDRLPQGQALATDAATADTRTIPFGDGAILQKTTVHNEAQILGHEYLTENEVIVATDASFRGDSSPEARMIVRRTRFQPSSESSSEVLRFEPTGRVLLIGYRGVGFTGLPRLEIITFSNKRETLVLSRSGTRHDLTWVTPSLGIPAMRHEYLIRTFGLNQAPINSKDLYIMYMQIAEEQARLENMRLSQELHKLKRE